MTVGRSTWDLLSQLKCGKPTKIIVWRNGDYCGPGREVFINPQYLTTWNSILNYLTEVLQPNFGAVRKLIHLDTRRKVEQFRDLKAMEKYVAVGINKFKYRKTAYGTEQKSRFPKKEKQGEAKVIETESILNFMATTYKNLRTVIYVMVSGRIHQEATKVVLTQLDMTSWSMVLKYLAKILDVPEGVECVCTPSGHIIENGRCLEHGGLYIALPFMEKFINKDYIGQFREHLRLKKFKSTSILKKKPKVSIRVKKETPKEEPEVRQCINKKCLTDDCKSEKQKSVPRIDVRKVANFIDNLIGESINRLEKGDLPATVIEAQKSGKCGASLKYNSFLANFEHRHTHTSTPNKIYTTFAEIAEKNEIGLRESSELKIYKSASFNKKNVNFDSIIDPIQVLANEASIFGMQNINSNEGNIHKQSSRTETNKFGSIKNSICLPRSERMLAMSGSNMLSLQSVKEDEDDSGSTNNNKAEYDEFNAIEVQVNNCCKQHGYFPEITNRESVLKNNINMNINNLKRASQNKEQEVIGPTTIATENIPISQETDRSIFKIQATKQSYFDSKPILQDEIEKHATTSKLNDVSETSLDNHPILKYEILKVKMVKNQLPETSDNSHDALNNNNKSQGSIKLSTHSDISSETEKNSNKSMDKSKNNIKPQSQTLFSSINQITEVNVNTSEDKINGTEETEKRSSVNKERYFGSKPVLQDDLEKHSITSEFCDVSEISSVNHTILKPAIPDTLKVKMVKNQISKTSNNSSDASYNNNKSQDNRKMSTHSDRSNTISNNSMDKSKNDIQLQSQKLFSSINQIIETSVNTIRDTSNNTSEDKINGTEETEKRPSINSDQMVEMSENDILNSNILVEKEQSQSESSHSDKMTMYESNNKNITMEKVDKSSQAKESTTSDEPHSDRNWNCLKENIISVACSEICIRICTKK